MDKEIQKKLEALRQTYAQHVPAKLEEIEAIGHQLQAGYHQANLESLQRLAHNLKGTSATYQYQALSEAAEKLEIHVESVLKQEAAFDALQIESLISNLRKVWLLNHP